MTSVNDDSRLARVQSTVDHIRGLLRSETSETMRDKLIPPSLKDDPIAQKELIPVLRFFGLARTICGRTLLIRDTPEAELTRKTRILSLVFWRLTSQAYPAQQTVSISKSEITELLAGYGLGIDDNEYEGLKACFRCMGYTQGESNRRGGLNLLAPYQLPPHLLNRTPGATPFAKPWDAMDEYDLYNDAKRPLIRFLRQSILSDAPNYSGWKIYLDKKGKKLVTSTAAVPDRGKWQNPDVFAHRSSQQNHDLENLSFEVKLRFDQEGIHEAESYFEFSHLVYLIVAESVDTLIKHHRFMRLISEKGLGLIGLRLPYNENTWLEVQSPRYRACRRQTAAEMTQRYEERAERVRARSASA